MYLEGREQGEPAVFGQGTATAGPDFVARTWARAGCLGLRLAQACCFVLVLTLVWGPRWPFSSYGLAALPYGILDTNFDPADFFVMGIIAGWGLALLSGQDRIDLSPRWIVGPLLLFALAGGLAVVGALNHAAAIQFAVRSAGLAMLYLYLHRSLAARRLAPATLAVWLAPGLAFNGLLAIAQTIHQNWLGLAWLGESYRLRDYPPTPVILIHGQRFLRAFGLLPHANVLGGLLAAALPVVVGAIVRPDGSGGAAMARRLPRGRALGEALLLLSVALMAAGIILSFSRSAWLGLLCGGLYLVVRQRLGRRKAILRTVTKRGVLVVASIVVVMAGLLLVEWDAVSTRLQPTSNRLERTSIQQRLSFLDLTFKIISWRPLTGVGGDNYALAADRFLTPDQHDQAFDYPVPNTYLLAQAELGPMGAAAWLVLMLVPALGPVILVSRRRTARAVCMSSTSAGHDVVTDRPGGYAGREISAHMPWQGLAGCSLTVVAVVGLFDWYIWGSEPVAVLWVMALAIFTAPAYEPRALGQVERRRIYPIIIVVVPLAILAVGGFEYLYRDRALPRVTVNAARINAGGQTQDAIALRLRPFSLTQRFRAIALIAPGRAPILIPAYKLGYSIDNGLTAWRAYSVGHRGSLQHRIAQQVRALLYGVRVGIAQRVDEIALRRYLFRLQGAVNRPPWPGLPDRALDVAPAQRQITHLLLHKVGPFRVYLPFITRPALPNSQTAPNQNKRTGRA
jgi:hypothetical protein